MDGIAIDISHFNIIKNNILSNNSNVGIGLNYAISITIPHEPSTFRTARPGSVDEVADDSEPEHRNLHFFIFGHHLSPFVGFF